MNAPEIPGEVWADYLEEQGMSVEEFRAWLAWGVFLADGVAEAEGTGFFRGGDGRNRNVSWGNGGVCRSGAQGSEGNGLSGGFASISNVVEHGYGYGGFQFRGDCLTEYHPGDDV